MNFVNNKNYTHKIAYMSMKNNTIVQVLLSMLLSWVGMEVQAQDFKLYFANNITDITDFTKIEDESSPLLWREVKDKDISGNLAEVMEVRRMFASQDLKFRAQQQQFWTMRDHCLLCFRINDGQGKTGSYTVEVCDSAGKSPQTLSVSRYFYVNAPRQGEDVKIKVYKTGNEADSISFKYHVYDWGDDDLYIFQLDSKRQLSKEVYRLQYVLGHSDEDGTFQRDTTTLSLRETAFQSFYVDNGHDLMDVFLISGDPNYPEEEHKLRLNKARLHSGVTLDPDYSVTSLSSTFKLDKHEDRELVNFNWIGSGLYERFDTLYVKLLNSKGEDIERATFHVEAINEKGERIPNTDRMRYLGYDRKIKQHRLLTFGRPAFMEIVASGYVPRLYKYPGAADPVTRIVDESLCSATVQLLTNRNNDGGIAMSSSHVMVLHDTKNVVYIYGDDHAECDIEDFDITFRPTADTLYYVQDAGHQYPKVMNNGPIEKYAKMELSFAIPRGQSIGSVKLFGTDVASEKEYEFDRPSARLTDISDFPSFTYNYVDMSYNMEDVLPFNKLFRLKMKAGNFEYAEFPYFYPLYIDRKKAREEVEKKAKEHVPGTNNKSRDLAFADAGFSLNMPANFTLNFSPIVVTQSLNIDFRNQVITSNTTMAYGTQGASERGSVLREEAKEYYGNNKQSLWYKDKDHNLGYNQKGTAKLEDWILNEMDDIFSYTPAAIGVGMTLSGTLGMSMPFGPGAGTNGNYFILDQLSFKGGYGISLASPDLLNSYLNAGGFGAIFKKLPCFHIGFNFDARAEVEGGVKMYDKAGETFNLDSYGYYGQVSLKAKVGVWAEFSTPPNPMFHVAAGVRGGLKLGVGYGLAGPFKKQAPDHGGFGLVVGGVEAYANIHSFIFNWAGRAGFTWGKKWLFPKDNNHNPFHAKYPWWVPNNENAKTVAESYRRLPLLGASTFGATLVGDVAADANPHFLDDTHVVYNDLRNPADYNDDCVTVLNMDDNTSVNISQSDNTTMSHMRSKRGEHEVVVFEELGRKVETSEVVAETAAEKSNELSSCTFLSSVIKNVKTGLWEKINITTNDGYVDSKPVVTVQDDGKAACVWQRGFLHLLDEEVPNDTLYNNALRGNLVLSIYDGSSWSKPVSLYNLDEYHVAAEYDLIMRNDTVLVGTRMVDNPQDSLKMKTNFSFASVDNKAKTVHFTKDPITPLHFFMNRVGQHGVIAMLYEKNDSTRDIYVKTLAMSGRDNGLTGSDIGANFCSPNRVKIICDRAAENLNDFAILWTEMNNVAHNSGEANTNTDEVRLMLNASRISLQPAPHITAPITLGCERDSLIMTDFDGFLDDSRIKVVYSLANIETGAAVIMSNEKYFTNSFEYDLSYPKDAVLASSYLPLSLEVRNTGTSGIRQVTARINGREFVIADSYVPPLQKRSLVVNYPIGDDFDGYITSDVIVDYDNIFRAQHHPKRKNVSFRRQIKTKTLSNVSMEDVECQLIGHSVEDGVNNFVVELTDHSVRGMSKRHAVHVGVYAHPTNVEPILDDAVAIVTADDFSEIAGQRKAYATVRVAGIKEPVRAYVSTHVFNTIVTDNLFEDYVENRHARDNAHYITLLPHNDPTIVERIMKDEDNKMVSFFVKAEDNGLRISGLKKGTHLRIYGVNGIMLFNKADVDNEVFVPLKSNNVYLISDGKEILKYAF